MGVGGCGPLLSTDSMMNGVELTHGHHHGIPLLFLPTNNFKCVPTSPLNAYPSIYSFFSFISTFITATAAMYRLKMNDSMSVIRICLI